MTPRLPTDSKAEPEESLVDCFAPGIANAVDDPEIPTGKVGVRIAEMRRVRHVEHFGAELDIDALADLEFPEQSP